MILASYVKNKVPITKTEKKHSSSKWIPTPTPSSRDKNDRDFYVPEIWPFGVFNPFL